MKKLLLNDQSRCDNESCTKRSQCRRFLQLEKDFNSETLAAVWVSSFREKDCEHYLELKTSCKNPNSNK